MKSSQPGQISRRFFVPIPFYYEKFFPDFLLNFSLERNIEIKKSAPWKKSFNSMKNQESEKPNLPIFFVFRCEKIVKKPIFLLFTFQDSQDLRPIFIF